MTPLSDADRGDLWHAYHDSSEAVLDHATPLLHGMNLSIDDKAALWDAFFSVDSAEKLSHVLSRLPADISEPLVEAKRLSTRRAIRPEHELAMAPVLKAMAHMVTIEPDVLDLFERHPQVFRHYMQMAAR